MQVRRPRFYRKLKVRSSVASIKSH
jgi:hypothetical protein